MKYFHRINSLLASAIITIRLTFPLSNTSWTRYNQIIHVWLIIPEPHFLLHEWGEQRQKFRSKVPPATLVESTTTQLSSITFPIRTFSWNCISERIKFTASWTKIDVCWFWIHEWLNCGGRPRLVIVFSVHCLSAVI